MATEIPSTMKAVIAEDGTCVVVERPVPTPGDRELLVRIHATAINRADTLQRAGKYPPPPGACDVLGLEMAGEVVAKGDGCVHRIPIGSHVMSLLASGGYAEYITVDESLVMRVPEGFDFSTAAAVPETWLTAFQLIHFVAHIKAGDVVLVHAAGSGVGTAATQLCVGIGATVIAIAGAQPKLDMAMSLGASHAFNYKTEPFAPKVMEATGGAGVNVILDCVGASNWAQNAEVAAMDARWVLFGLMGGAQPDAPVLGHILRKRLHVLGTTLRTRTHEYKVKLSNEFASHAVPKFLSGAYKPILDARSFDGLDAVQAAHEYMESNANIGKIVVRVP